jgi:hypothetical protein
MLTLRSRALVASALLAIAVAACGTSDIAVLSAEVDGGAPPSGDAGSRAAYCAGSGAPVLVDDTDAGVVTTCAAQLAQVAFRYALCTCDGYVSDHVLTTDAFDSTQGAYGTTAPLAGGSVGTNGSLNASAAMNIGGSLWATDSTGLTTNANITTTGELHAEGEVHAGPMLTVGADAWLAGGLQTAGAVTVTGTLRVPTGEPLSIGGQETVGATDGASFHVPAACDCAPEDLVDVAGFVESYRTVNDDAAATIDPTMLENVNTALTATIPCGRIFFTRIGATAPIHLTIQGRAAIFVGGALSTTSDFVVDVPSGSELDLFIEDGVTVGGAFLAGDPANPAKARTYVGGSDTVDLQGPSQLAGNLYAPYAQLVLGGAAPATLFGSIFAARINAGSDLTIHYDEAILSGGASSGCATPSTCSSCRDCGGQSCNSGTCGGCTDSAQCCAPLVCVDGACAASAP